MNQPVIIEVSTEEMFRNYLDGIIDIAWDLRKEQPFSTTISQDLVQALMRGNMERIRKGFGCGETFLLLGSKQMSRVETVHGTKFKADRVHIRVTHEGNVIGELVDCEISY